ncbi:PilZ domain-containing protein [Methylomonas sp. MgM2]
MSECALEEKRNFQRFVYNAKAILVGDEFTFPCRIIDMCLKGCLLEFERPWSGSAGDFYTLILGLSEKVFINMQLQFAHGQGKQIGFKCNRIDIDSMTSLRRLVELNLGASVMLERELSALGKLKK